MPDLSRDGVSLSFDDVGSGPPMVFIHGWCCDRSYLAPQVAHFSKTHRCIAPDLRGHGASDAPEQEYTIASHADDVAWLCGELGLEKPVLVGHSMGGSAALAAAAAHPELPRAIVMLDGAFLFPEAARGPGARIAEAFRSPAYRDVLRPVYDGLFIATDDAARRKAIVDAALEAPQHVMASEWEAIQAFDAEAAAKACTVPAMYVGAHAPIADMRRLRELMPGLVPAQTAGAGHFHQLEVPEQVNVMIERFLAIKCGDSG